MAKPYIFPPSHLKFIHQFYLKMQQTPSEVIFSRQRIARCNCARSSVRYAGQGGMPLLVSISLCPSVVRSIGKTVTGQPPLRSPLLARPLLRGGGLRGSLLAKR